MNTLQLDWQSEVPLWPPLSRFLGVARSPQDHVLWRLDELGQDIKEVKSSTDELERIIRENRGKIDRLENEIKNVHNLAEKVSEVTKNLELKDRQDDAELRARIMIAKWAQFFIGGLILLGTLWSTRWLNALEQIKALLGSVK